MSYYRDVYLKSEDWKNLRAAILATKGADGRCHICDEIKRLDVHHIWYKRLYDVGVHDLTPICRDCHNKVHKLLRDPKAKKIHPQARWHIMKNVLRLPTSLLETVKRRTLEKIARHNSGRRQFRLSVLNHEIASRLQVAAT